MPSRSQSRADHIIYKNDFDDDPAGVYTVENLNGDWNNPANEGGVAAGRVRIVEGENAFRGKSLQVAYPKGNAGLRKAGAKWRTMLGGAFCELYCAYRLRFGEGFDFVRGGKIPGLAGGRGNTAGNKPNGRDGWSARMMWKRDGLVVQYVYHPDQPGTWGHNLPYDLGGQRYFKPGVWHQVEHRIVMNTPGKKNGIIQAWFDGELALDAQDLRFRDGDDLAIDCFLFSTFFGGSGPDWAATRDECITFDEFVISTKPIAH
jgi:hypothetical protein